MQNIVLFTGLLLLLFGLTYVITMIGHLHTQGAFKEHKKTIIGAYIAYLLYFMGFHFFGNMLWKLLIEIFNNFTS